MLEDAKRGMEIGEKVMIELFTTPKEQVKIELFQYILFSRAGEFSKDLKEKLNLKNETLPDGSARNLKKISMNFLVKILR